MKKLQDVFTEFCGFGCIDICGDPDLLLQLSDALLEDAAGLLRYHYRAVKSEEIENLKSAQENFTHVANLLAFVLTRMDSIDEVKNDK